MVLMESVLIYGIAGLMSIILIMLINMQKNVNYNWKLVLK